MVNENSTPTGSFIWKKSESQSKTIALRVSSKSQRIYVRSSRTLLVLAAVLFALPWLLLALFYFGFFTQPSPPPRRALVATSEQPEHGPWGALKSFEYVTDPPSEFLTDDLFPPNTILWCFGEISRDALDALFHASGLPSEQSARMLATANSVPKAGWVLRPADDDVLNMSPTARKTLYDPLAKIAINKRQTDPFVLDPDLLDAGLNDAHLAPTIVENVKKLLYPHDNSVLLADVPLLMKTIPSSDDRRAALNVLVRRKSVMLKLARDEHADIAELAHYWGAGGREIEVRPLLESLQHSTDGMTIDVALLLPRFARDRLYMYPSPSADPLAMRRDCHWTAFNFFNDSADDRWTDPAKIKPELSSHYQPVSGSPRFGDIAMLTLPDNRVVHSSVYIAGDYYFSKNGPATFAPWLLTRLWEMKGAFPAYDNLTMKYFRRR